MVLHASTTKVQTIYESLGANIIYTEANNSVHEFPTDLKRNKNRCIAPYLANCEYDGIGNMFRHIIPGQEEQKLNERALDWQKHGTMKQFNQKEFLGPGQDLSNTSFDPEGYFFVPTECETESCKIHVSLHGCHGGRKFAGPFFAENAGYLEYASTNKIILLFP